MTAHALCIGNFTVDLTERGEAPGGSVFYSGCTFAALGIESRIVAAAGPDLPIDAVHRTFDFRLALQGAGSTTSMRNTYVDGVRQQVLSEAGETIRAVTVPEGWSDDAIVLLCPVFGELDPQLTRRVRGRITGVSLQGWLREADSASRIIGSTRTDFLTDLAGVDVLFISDEDVMHAPHLVQTFTDAAPVLVQTHGPQGATVGAGGRTVSVPGIEVHETDPTGAGDTFAAAFLTHYTAHGDPFAAAQFGCMLASIVVRFPGPLTPSLLNDYHDLVGDALGELAATRGRPHE